MGIVIVSRTLGNFGYFSALYGYNKKIIVSADGDYRIRVANKTDFFTVRGKGVIMTAAQRDGRSIVVTRCQVFDIVSVLVCYKYMGTGTFYPAVPVPIKEMINKTGFYFAGFFFG